MGVRESLRACASVRACERASDVWRTVRCISCPDASEWEGAGGVCVGGVSWRRQREREGVRRYNL